ncbi:hypothetical protein M422DRAFT_776549 [Sphaerobolus stellatus SS14]|nr:hypothetical protein M422DRAFT_776549 [Sphaerobolus stellatus SS14]
MAPVAGSSRHNNKKPKKSKSNDDSSSSSNLPGVQKIKASLRQTKRLLAKENLAADVRIESERRLRSLEADLAKAERARKERSYATKYHKIKFFERQKVCRKIKQLKKEIEDSQTSLEKLSSIRDTLLARRVDLNYILHYPKTQKYISLFPPPSLDTSDPGVIASDTKREELRQMVKTAMEKGEMDAEPELTMDTRRDADMDAMELDDSETNKSSKKSKQKKDDKPKKPKGLQDDGFFDESEDDEDEEG